MSGSGEIFFYFKGFSGTDIYHSDVKMRLCKVSVFSYSFKIIYQNFHNFLRPNAWEIKKFFLNLLKNSNSIRQNNIKKCLNLDAIWKKISLSLLLWPNNQARETFPENFLGNSPNSGNSKDFWDTGNFPGKFLKITRFPVS